jgi:predicted transcriptional regulator
MQVTLSAELQAKLARIAQERGTNPQDVAREAIERLVYDERFVHEVEKGLAQIDGGQTLSHEEVGARLNKHLAGKQPSRCRSFAGPRKLQTISNASPITFCFTHRTGRGNY